MTIYASVDSSIRDRVSAMNRALAEGGAVVDTALPDTSREAASDAASTIAHATELANTRDWKAVSELDTALAGIAWTDSAKARATQLRAEWRTHVISPAPRRQAGEECVSIVDDAIVVQPTLALYSQRARCGLIAGRNDVVIESLWNLGNSTYYNARGKPADQRETARRNLQTLIVALEKNLPVAQSTAFDGARRDEVALKLRAHIARLQ